MDIICYEGYKEHWWGIVRCSGAESREIKGPHIFLGLELLRTSRTDRLK